MKNYHIFPRFPVDTAVINRKEIKEQEGCGSEVAKRPQPWITEGDP